MMTLTNQDLSKAFSQMQHSLRGYLRRRLGDPHMADDLLQEVFIKALNAQHAGQRIDNLAGWLHTATRNVLVDHLRSAGEPARGLDDNLPQPEPQDVQLHHELSACLRPFIEQLPALYRETLLATEYQGRTMRSLAEAQGVSVSAIKSRAMRARAQLRDAVLACCQVEMEDGIVSDYRKKSLPGNACQ